MSMTANEKRRMESLKHRYGREVAAQNAVWGMDREVLEAAVWQKERQRTVKQP